MKRFTVTDSFNGRTVLHVNADEMRFEDRGLQDFYVFYVRTGRRLFGRWRRVGAAERRFGMQVTSEDIASDEEFLKAARVSL